MQGISLLIHDDKIDLLVDLHPQADLGERCVPVGRQLGLLGVKPSLSSCEVDGFSVAPKTGTVMEGFLCVDNKK